MRAFLLRSALFSLLVISLMTILDKMVTAGLHKTGHESFRNWNEIMDAGRPINADILVLGSSRARVQVSPAKLDSVLGVSAYIIGQDGTGVDAHMAKYSVYRLNNKAPRLLIQVLDINSFQRRDTLVGHQQFMPYLSIPAIAGLTRSKRGFTMLTYRLPFARYFGDWNFIRVGLLEAAGLKHYTFPLYYKGYEPRYLVWNDTEDRNIKVNHDPASAFFDSSLVYKYQQFITRCQEEGIRVLFVYPPHFKDMKTRIASYNAVFDSLNKLTNRCNAAFLNYADDSIGSDRANFYNSTHMNAEASGQFSGKLARDLKKILEEKF